MTIVAELLRLFAAVMLPVPGLTAGEGGFVSLVLVAGIAAAGVAAVVAVVRMLRIAPVGSIGPAERTGGREPVEAPLQWRPDAPGRRLPRAPGAGFTTA